MVKKYKTTGRRIETPHPIDIHVGNRIKERRIACGFTQSELGEALYKTFQQIQKYERGDNRISASMLYECARFLGVDISYFFDGITDTDSPSVNSNIDTEKVDKNTIQTIRLFQQAPVNVRRIVLDMLKVSVPVENEPIGKISKVA